MATMRTTSRRVGYLVALLLLLLLGGVTAGGHTPALAAPVANAVVAENQQPGTSAWKISLTPSDDVNRQIEGYASSTSVNAGDTINLYVTTSPAQAYSMDVYRIGYYQGLGGRLMQHLDLQGNTQPDCPMDAATGLRACSWSVSQALTVPSAWTSGVYLVKLTNAAQFQNYAMFVVRNDDSAAPLLYQQSVATYQAYNNWPNDVTGSSSTPASGKSLYDYNSSSALTAAGTKRASKISYDRPYSNDDGAGDFLDYELNFVRWAEQSGYDLTYSTDVDTDLSGARLLTHKGFLSVGHDEYWTKAMYDNVAAARDKGVGLGFFGGNAVYWQMRFEDASDGRPDRVQVCYKSTADPIQDATTTVKWRDASVNRPEQQLMGGMFTSQQASSLPPSPYIVANADNWVYAGTNVKNSDAIPGVVGYESDRYVNTYPAPASAAGTYFMLSSSPYTTTNNTTDYQQSSVYQAPSGAWVFNAGTIDWSYGLYNTGNRNYADPRLQQMTRNVLDRLGAGSQPLPPAPTGFTTVPTGGGVSVSWTSSGSAATGYVLDRSTTPTFDSLSSTSLPASSTSYQDSSLAAAAYYYRIRAVNDNGNSPYVTASVSTIAYTTAVDQTAGLQAHWRLGETSGTTGWDTTGTYNGSYTTGTTLGAAGAVARDADGAASFNGSAGRVSIPALPTAGDFTIEGWTNLAGSTVTNNTLYGGNSTLRVLARPTPTSTTTAYAGVFLSGTEYALQPGGSVSNVGSWVHWALTRSGGTLTLFRNGVQVGQRSDLPAAAAANLAGYIGASIGGAYYMAGAADEVAVYNRSLSSTEVSNHYVAALNGPAPTPAGTAGTSYRDLVTGEPSLTNYWRLGEASGTAAVDAKGGANGTYAAGTTLGAAGAINRDTDTAVTFNGSGGRVNLPAVPSVTDFSVEGWSYLTNAGSNNNAVYGANGTVRLVARPGTTANSTSALASVFVNGTEYSLQPTTTGSNVGAWVHWVMTRKGSQLMLYRNGLVISQRNDLPAGPASISGAIGSNTGSYYLTGRIDDVALYNSALSPAAVTAHYRAATDGMTG